MRLRKDIFPPIVLFFFLLFSFGYFHHIQAGWNINTRFALTMAIVERGTFAIDAYHDNPELPFLYTNDKALYQNHYYCDKSPALSFTGVPVYAAIWKLRLETYLFSGMSEYVKILLSRYIVRLLTVSLPSALLGVLLLFLSRRFGASQRLAFFLSIAMLWGTMLGAYATLFYPYLPSALCFMGAYALLLQYRLKGLDNPEVPPPLAAGLRLFWVGLLVGLAWFYEFTTGLVGIGLGAYALWTIRRRPEAIWKFIIGGLIPVALFYSYTYSIFGEFTVPYRYESNDFFREQMARGFRGIHVPKLSVLYYITVHPLRGLFFFSPFLYLWFIGLYRHLKRSGLKNRFSADVILSIYIIIAYFAFASGYYMWWGGWAAGARNLCPAIPFFLPPIALWLSRSAFWKNLLFAGLMLVSLILNFMIIAHDPQIQTNNIIPKRVELRYMQETGKRPHQIDYTALLHDTLMNPRISDNIESPALKWTYSKFLGLDDEEKGIEREPEVALNLGHVLFKQSGLSTLILLGLVSLAVLAFGIFGISPAPDPHQLRMMRLKQLLRNAWAYMREIFHVDQFGISTGGELCFRLLEALLAIVIIVTFLSLRSSPCSVDTLLLQPQPEAIELAYQSAAMAEGVPPLLPIVNELHAPRFSPVHAFFASAFVHGASSAIRNLCSWSTFAFFVGWAAFYWLAIRLRLHPLLRLALLFFLVFSPLTHELSRGILQEPTLFMLMALAAAFWSEGMCRMTHIFKKEEVRFLEKASAYLFSSLGFVAASLMVCIRPSALFLPALLVLQYCILFGSYRGRRFATYLGVLFAATLLASASFALVLEGALQLTNYSAWNAWFGFHFPWQAPVNMVRSAPGSFWLVFGGILGFREGVVYQYSFSVLILLAGCSGLLVKPAEKNDSATSARVRRVLALVLLIFGITTALLHTFYAFYADRFMILVAPPLVFASLVGWQAIIELIPFKNVSAPKRATTVAALALCLVFGTGLFYSARIFPEIPDEPEDVVRHWQVSRDLAAHDATALLLRNLNCPYFVQGIPIVSSRIYLDRVRMENPISQIFPASDGRNSPHLQQLQSLRGKEPRSYLNTSSVWRRDLADCFLYAPGQKAVNAGFVQDVLQEYGRFALYYPAEFHDDITLLLDWLRDRDYIVRDWTQDPRMALYVVHKNDNNMPDADLLPRGASIKTLAGRLGEPMHLDIGRCRPSYLGAGWGQREDWNEWTRVRWITGYNATVFFPVPQPGTAYLKIRLESVDLGGDKRQTIMLSVNGQVLGSRSLYDDYRTGYDDHYGQYYDEYYGDEYYEQGGMTEVSWHVPEELLVEGFNRFEFTMGQAVVPAETDPQSDDTRLLSAAVDWVQLEVTTSPSFYPYP